MWARAAKDSARDERVRPMLRSGLLCIWRKCGLFDGEHVENVGFFGEQCDSDIGTAAQLMSELRQ